MASTKFTTVVRSLSSSSSSTQGMVKPPIKVFGIEGRYATALFSAGSKQNKLEAIEKDLIKFQTALKSDKVLKEFVDNPINKRSLKSSTLQLAAKKLALSPPSSNFLSMLAENGRLQKLNSIINSFKIIMAAHRGDLPCVVTTAKPLDAAEQQELKKTLQAFSKKGETIKLELKVDSSLIGGMIVSIGDKYVDMSVATKIKKYTEIIQDAVWQRRRPDVDTVFAKAMAETGQIKIFGDHPTRTEAALAKTRRHLHKEERLEAEQRRLEEIGPIAYYSEWVETYKQKDTSWEAIQKHFEETGEDENTQLITMFQHQTAGEYRIMMGTDVRIQRDPLAMRMREDQIKQIWGGDPVYPTVNYVQDPDEVIDYRSPEFHEPTPEVVPYLMEHGIMITKEELDARLMEEEEDVDQDITYIPEVKDPMATAVDIGEHSFNEDSDDEEEVDKAVALPESLEDEEDGGDEAVEVEGKVSQNWSVLKTTGQDEKPKEKLKKDQMSLKDAINESENLTDFLMDFEEDE